MFNIVFIKKLCIGKYRFELSAQDNKDILSSCREGRRIASNQYLAQLALADFLFLFFLPFQVDEMLKERWLFGDAWCKITESVRYEHLCLLLVQITANISLTTVVRSI